MKRIKLVVILIIAWALLILVCLGGCTTTTVTPEPEEPTSYEITLRGEGGTPIVQRVTVRVDYTMPVVTLPTRYSYNFGGYYSGRNCRGTMYYDDYGPMNVYYKAGDPTTLYACWYYGG